MTRKFYSFHASCWCQVTLIIIGTCLANQIVDSHLIPHRKYNHQAHHKDESQNHWVYALSKASNVSSSKLNNTIEETEYKSGYIKLALAIACFVGVLVCCGLPVLITDCLQKRNKSRVKSIQTDDNTIVANHEHSIFGQDNTMNLWLGRCNCLAAGVFLSTGFMELYPEVEQLITEAKATLHTASEFPFAPLLVLLGFFLILSVEQTVWFINSAKSTSCSMELRDKSNMNVESYPKQNHGRDNLIHAKELSFGTLMRTILLLSAMSVHSVFEGLAIGLQLSMQYTLSLFTAIMLHKSIISIGIGVNLAATLNKLRNEGVDKISTNGTDQPNSDDGLIDGLTNGRPIPVSVKNKKKTRIPTLTYEIIGILIFAMASPVGIVIGLVMVTGNVQSSLLIVSTTVLQGLACGTFFYVVFCELLPEEFNTGNVRDCFSKLVCLLLAFVFVTIYIWFKPG